MLSFKEEQVVDTKPIHIEEPKIDIIKLMRYTKRGNKKWFKEELKKKSVKRISGLKPRPKTTTYKRNNLKNPQKKSNTNISENKEINIQSETNNYNENEKNENENNIIDFSNFNANKTNAFSNFKNSIKKVRNEAQKAYFLDENFNKKKDVMDSLFNNKILPKIEDYEYLIQKNEKKRPKVKKMLDIEKTDEEEYGENKNKKEKKKELLRHEIISFSKKKLTWTKEDFLRDQSKKKIKMFEKKQKNI